MLHSPRIYRDGDRLVLCIGCFGEDRPKKFDADIGKPSLVVAPFQREPAK